MKINKILVGLVAAGVCGVGITAMASSNDGLMNKIVEVKPVEVTAVTSATESTSSSGNISTSNLENVNVSEIESYITNKYGSNWAKDLSIKNGHEWNDILEDELEAYFGHKYEDLIDNIIEREESKLYSYDIEDDYNYKTTNVKRDEIVKNIESKYGTNWASDLLAKNGSNWDDILENELELQYGEKYDDVIEDIIDDKEHESRLDYDDKDFEDLFDYND